MNLEEIKGELRKLSELVGDWSEQRPIPPLERDLVLEKLRAVYEALRFGVDPSVMGVPKRVLPAAAPSDTPAPGRFRRPGRFDEEPDIEVVDLSEVLSLDDVAEPEEPMAAVSGESVQTPHAGVHSAAYAETQSAASASVAPAAPVAPEPEEEGPEVIEFEPEPEPEPEFDPAYRVAPAASFREEPAPEPVSVPSEEFVATPEPLRVAEPVAASRPVAAAENVNSRPQPAPQPEEAVRPDGKSPGGEAQSLFGPDEEAVRHRHKQRVIMSLYDNTPRSASDKSGAQEPAAPKHREPEAPKFAGPTGSPVSAFQPRPAVAEPDEPEIVLIETGYDEPAAPMSEPEEEGPEILMLDDEPAEAPVRRPAPAPSPAPARRPAPAPAAPRPAATPASAVRRPGAATAGESGSQVLGEVINHDVRTLGETIAAPRKNYGAPVADLRQAIGINDKFLMIRDLFGGNSVLFDATITALNAQESLDDCMIYIAEHFAWNPDSDSARLIMELLERKFA